MQAFKTVLIRRSESTGVERVVLDDAIRVEEIARFNSYRTPAEVDADLDAGHRIYTTFASYVRVPAPAFLVVVWDRDTAGITRPAHWDLVSAHNNEPDACAAAFKCATQHAGMGCPTRIISGGETVAIYEHQY